MRRRVLAAVWITGATVPLLLGTVFVFGCCVLPFHHVVHKLMPICEMAANIMRGEAHAEHEHDTTPAREKQEPPKRVVTQLPGVVRIAEAATTARVAAPSPVTGYRSFITLGAVRCDRDVGLHVLVATFLI